ncbi:ABC transporter permease [Actinospica sp. MGRD01-02]|uniref:ABC transporter permease n=1 Tax=Actinospica acidithermotolerans TaxID=2828514 RepID=A0A941ED73_9ACTN|nr:ABC transporter permease [Actinospica acidithermotolerans]MBR7829351.1 ABC transporter permease [Actinospica acidithermotolerans]
MTAMTVDTAAAPARLRRGLTVKGFFALAAMHLKLMRREPGAFVTILLPVVLLTIFGSIASAKTPQADLGGRSVLDVYVPTIAAMTPLMVACTVLPGAMASFRERNTLRRFQVSPVPPGGMLAALVSVLAAFAALSVVLIVLLGTLVFGAKLPPNLGAVISAFALGFVAVIAVGMVPAAVATTNTMANGIGIPFMILNFFFAGLYIPIAQMPHVMQTIGEYVPFGAVMDAWSGTGALWQHLAVLAGYTVLGGLASAKLFRWE